MTSALRNPSNDRLTDQNRVDYREAALQSLSQLPPFSPILNRLLATLGSEDVSFAEVGGWIEKDAVITGQVLRMVNSAAYGRRGTVNSVRHAVSMLGVNKVRNCVLGLSISRLWTRSSMPPYWSPKRFNLHSVATAVLADLIAQRLPVEYGEGAFVAGILHDVGQLMMALSLPSEHARIIRTHLSTGEPLSECERAVLGVTHPELSEAALSRWNLPVPIQKAVAEHHTLRVTGEPLRLCHLLHAADETVNQLGISTFATQDGPPAGDGSHHALTALGLEGSEWKIMSEFQKDYEAIRAFF